MWQLDVDDFGFPLSLILYEFCFVCGILPPAASTVVKIKNFLLTAIEESTTHMLN